MSLDGILIIDKPRGYTSRKAVSEARKAAGAAKAGHAGTLDPLATGVLVVCLNRGTLLSRILSAGDKCYHVESLLGIETDTYDADGKILSRKKACDIDEGVIEGVLEGFKGEIRQKPPLFSAVKYRGRPLYYYARRGREVFPEARTVRIDEILLKSLQKGEDGTRVVLEITCGPGTFIRSIVHDMGAGLGCGAAVMELRRLRSGSFEEKDALSLEKVVEGGRDVACNRLVSMEEATSGLPTVAVSENDVGSISMGRPLLRDFISEGNALYHLAETSRVLDGRGKLIALYGPPRPEDDEIVVGRAIRVIRPHRSFVENHEAAS